VGRSWEGAQPGSRPKLAMEIFHTIDVMTSLYMGVGWGGRNLSLFREFKSSLVQELELFQEFHEIHEICRFWVP